MYAVDLTIIVRSNKREKDKIKEQFLNEKGYKFIYFWEVDIHNSLADVTTKLLKFIRG